MDDQSEVKYMPTIGSNVLPFNCSQWVKMKDRKSNNQLSVFLSVLSLVIALSFFALIFNWLWGVPEKVASNEAKINALEDALEIHPGIKEIESTCSQPKAVGNCYASMPRWYFDNESKKCTQFQYSGCNGNKNNFHTQSRCTSTCGAGRVGIKNNRDLTESTGKFMTRRVFNKDRRFNRSVKSVLEFMKLLTI